MRAGAALICLGAAVAPQGAQALDLSLPRGAQQTAQIVRADGSYDLATGPWSEAEGVPVRMVAGDVSITAWRLGGSSATPLQLMASLTDQIAAAEGWTVVYRCAARACGGFDFRFGIELLPAPEMYVDLTAYRYLAAEGPEGAALSVVTSRSDAAAYVQIAQVSTAADAPAPAIAPTGPDPAAPGPAAAAPARDTPVRGAVAERLEAEGRVVLTDMRFATGSASLDGTVASLDALAVYLAEAADRRIVFVGHTDATGSLEANRALSRRRAAAAETYLRQAGVSAAQVSAQGVGYLAPIASNLTEEGRLRNRRVEAVLLP